MTELKRFYSDIIRDEVYFADIVHCLYIFGMKCICTESTMNITILTACPSIVVKVTLLLSIDTLGSIKYILFESNI